MIDPRAQLGELGAVLVPKNQSAIMRLVGLLVPDFMSRFWTTIGRRIYYPSSVTDPYAHPEMILHELVHVRQWRRFGPAFILLYVAFPLPVGLAWFRWWSEREAYLVNIEAGRDIDSIVDTLWRSYAWPWPKKWMRRWFVVSSPVAEVAHHNTELAEHR